MQILILDKKSLQEKVRFHSTHVDIMGELDYQEWEAVIVQLKSIQGAIQWWLGDLLNYGEARYGETYSQVLDATEYEYQTLANFKYVAGRIPPERRKKSLSFSHHVEVASLEPPLQEELLREAENLGLSTKELRKRVKEVKQKTCEHVTQTVEVQQVEVVKCLDCGEVIERRNQWI